MTAVLVIAGTDSSGGAGLTRDVATLTVLGVDALCAVTAVTAQTNTGVAAVHTLPAQLVQAQIAAALAGGRARAVKCGMLATRATVQAVADGLALAPGLPLVLDPVLAASSGAALLDASGRQALLERLLARSTVLTPNVAEAAALLEVRPGSGEEELVAQARALCGRGAAAVLLKGGHAAGPAAIDWLVSREGTVHRFSAPRSTRELRGTGCALASGIAAGLAAGLGLIEACERAKQHVTALLRHNP